MRILMTSDEAGGLGVHAHTLARALAQRGHAVTLAVLGVEPGRRSATACGTDWRRPQRGVAVHRAPGALEWESERAPAALAAAAAAHRAWLGDLAEQTGAELLHANHFIASGAAPALPTLLGVHSDVVSWWRAVHGSPPPASQFHAWYRTTAERALRTAALVVAPSASARADLNQSFGWRGQVHVVANGIGAIAAPAAAKMPHAASLGRLWDEGKQAGLLWRNDLAMDVLVGGEDRGRFPAPPSRLHLLGPLDAAAATALLQRAQVYIGTSRYEPFGLAPLEAARAGCALLLNDIPSFRELWGDTAMYFHRNDGQSLALGLRELAADQTRAADFAAAAEARARKFSAECMAAEYERFYSRLIG